MSTRKQIDVSNDELARIIRSYQSNHLLSIKFTKKDGSIRNLVGRFGVRKGVNGKGLKYNPNAIGLICIFDVKADGFRMVSTDNLISAKLDGDRKSVV